MIYLDMYNILYHVIELYRSICDNILISNPRVYAALRRSPQEPVLREAARVVEQTGPMMTASYDYTSHDR